MPSMPKIVMLIMLLAASSPTWAEQGRLPIIDMHLHSYTDANYFVAPNQGAMAPATAEAHFEATYDIMRRHHIVLGVISNSRASEEAWMEKDEDRRFLRGVGAIDRGEWTPESFEEAVKAGRIQVLGETNPVFQGMTLADPYYEPYLKICEDNGIPVALHTGGGPPGITYRGFPKARIVLGNPLLVEDVLVKYPRLKIYLMHSGGNYYEEALRLMLQYRQVYTGLGALLWVHAMPKYYGREFLKQAKEFGLLDRVMFGSDPMVWPHAIELSLQELDSYDFLSDSEKRDILYHNAARFLGLSEQEIDAHHGR